jgi:hypothetical protein
MTARSRYRAHGWERDGELNEQGERQAEYEAEARAGYWDPPARFDDPGPDGMGWSPEPYPDSAVI